MLSPNLESVVAQIQPDYIFHLAAYGSLPQQEAIDPMFDVNVKGTIRLLHAVKKHPFRLFVHTGSSSEYGIKYKPMKETDIQEPINDYGISKLAATLYVRKEAIRYNLPIITFRLFSAYGYFEEPTRFIPWVIARALTNRQIALTSPTTVRSFTFIEDIVDTYLLATKSTVTPGDIINIATKKQYTLGETVAAIMKLTKSKSSLQWGKHQQQARQVEKGVWQGNIAHAKAALAWQPANTLEQGLEKTIQWMKEHEKAYKDIYFDEAKL